MAEINWLAVLLGALAFFLVGAIWYGVLFAKAWQRAAGLSDEAIQGALVRVTQEADGEAAAAEFRAREAPDS
mgnify:CR=1 FL=1